MARRNPERKWSFPKGEVSMEEAVEEAMRAIRADYYGSVRSHAKAIVESVYRGDIQDSDDLDKYLDQIVRGSNRVIYTIKTKLGLLASDNEDAWEDMTDEAPDEQEKMYFAMRQDVIDDLVNEFDIDPNNPVPDVTPLKSRRKR